jgi:phosphoribosylamine--glycine ligase
VRVLILGGGAREHAMAAAVARSSLAPVVFVAPGNVGMRNVATPIDIDFDNLDAVVAFAADRSIDLTIAGNEAPLVRGVADRFAARGLRLFGPSQAAARLEGSKAWAKDFMRRHAIPTADYLVVDSFAAAQAALARFRFPLVVKADGLAAGKGVSIVSTRAEAERVLHALLVESRCGDAGRRVVLEELLEGVELSVFAICDGASYRILDTAQDHKRALDGDRGPNTGGMGAYSPVPFVPPALRQDIEARIVVPTLAGMRDEGSPFRGFLYVGLMLTPSGPFVLEYNCRLGDPEAQVLLPRWRSDFLQLCLAAESGAVRAAPLDLASDFAVGVVVAAEGYPDAARTGARIEGVAAARALGNDVFCAGVAAHPAAADAWVTSGGRVLTVVGQGTSLPEARACAYAGVDCIRIEGAFYRRDIAARAQEVGPWPNPVSAS